MVLTVQPSQDVHALYLLQKQLHPKLVYTPLATSLDKKRKLNVHKTFRGRPGRRIFKSFFSNFY